MRFHSRDIAKSCLLCALSVAASCAHEYQPVDDAASEGQHVAAAQIAEGHPVIYRTGAFGGSAVDPETGLPQCWRGGCVPNGALQRFVDAHNEYINQHLKVAAATTRNGE